MCWNNAFNYDDRFLVKAVIEDFCDRLINVRLAAYTLSEDIRCTNTNENVNTAVQDAINDIEHAETNLFHLLETLESEAANAQAI